MGGVLPDPYACLCVQGIEKEYNELDTVWFMAGSLFNKYPYDIPTEAFSLGLFVQACPRPVVSNTCMLCGSRTRHAMHGILGLFLHKSMRCCPGPHPHASCSEKC